MAGAPPSASSLRSLELRLLRCTFFPGHSHPPPIALPSSPYPHPSSSLLPLIDSVVASIERGRYADALSSPAAQLVFPFASSWEFSNTVESAERFYAEAERSVAEFVRGGGGGRDEVGIQVLGTEAGSDGGDDAAGKAFLVVCIGVAAFLVFIQQNMTGPIGEFSGFPLQFFPLETEKSVKGGCEWDTWARKQLISSGSDLLGKFYLLQYLVFAKLLLSRTKDISVKEGYIYKTEIRTLPWWLFRVCFVQQRISEELSSSLYELLELFKAEVLQFFGNVEGIHNYWGSELCDCEPSSIVSMVHLELGIMDITYGRVDSSRIHFNLSEEASGLHLSVTGALGFRTIHQVDAKAQMVLVDTGSQESDKRRLIQCSNGHPSTSYLKDNDHHDILMTPKLVEDSSNDTASGDSIQDDRLASEPLNAIQQAVVLVQCLHINRSNPDDELSRWKIAPFVEAIDAQRDSPFSIRSFCDILRIQWEFSRSRTKDRAFMMMEKLVKCILEISPGPEQRIQLSFGVFIPTIPALRKEYGEFLVSFNLYSEAIKIFEELELWSNVIDCYCLVGKKSIAVDLIKARLVDFPNDPKLWEQSLDRFMRKEYNCRNVRCSLGDVTSTDAYYEKALEVSGGKSARAKRSLARNAYNRGDYVTSKVLWESAMAINSLHPDGWFSLGAAALKARDLDKALDSFTRAVQLDPDNGEAWNNIACLHLLRKRSKESFIAFKEALKFKRSSWQLWQNYSHVAMDVSNIKQALEATKMVLDLSSNKQIDTELLERIMAELEEQMSKSVTGPDTNPASEANGHIAITAHANETGSSEHRLNKSNGTQLLVDMLGKILQQIVKCGGEGVWGLYARWHRMKGDLKMCSEALLKQVRSYQGSDLWHNQERFVKFTRASLELCNIYMEISSSTGSHRELDAAEMHLRSSIKQAVNFSDTEEFRSLQSCLDEVKKHLQMISAESAPSRLM